MTGDSDVEAGIATLGLPLVVKSDQTWGGDGVVIAATREAVQQAAARRCASPRGCAMWCARCAARAYFLWGGSVSGAPPGISAQRFVAGPPATSSLACWQGEVVAAHHFDVLLTPHPTGPASVIARTRLPQMQASARRRGQEPSTCPACSGWIMSATPGGQVHLLEMNARAMPTSHLALDRDLPAALLAAAGLGWRRRPRGDHKPGKSRFSPANGCAIRPVPGSAAFHDVPWDDPAVVRACVQLAAPQRLAAAARQRRHPR